VSFENKSLENANLKKLSRIAYDRAKDLLDAWGIDGKTRPEVQRKRPATSPASAVEKTRK